MRPLQLAVLSLSRHQLTTVIAIIAIAVAVACSGTLLRLHLLSDSRFVALGQASAAIVGGEPGGIEILLGATNSEGSYPEFLPRKLYDVLLSAVTPTPTAESSGLIPDIAWISPYIYFAKLGTYRVVGTTENFFQGHHKREPLHFSEGKLFSNSNEAVVGAAVASRRRLSVGDTLEVTPWLGDGLYGKPISLQVSGVLAPTNSTWDRLIFSSLEQAQRVLENHLSLIKDRTIWGSESLHYYFIDYYPGTFDALKSLINQRTVGQVVRVEEQTQRLKELSEFGRKIGFFVATFVILLSGLGLCAMLVTRYEGMALQLAVLHALGYSKREIMTLLLWEGVLLGSMGVVLGAFIDFLVFPLFRSFLGPSLPPVELVGSTVFYSYPVWIAAFTAMVLAVVIPMVRMAMQDAHSFLKGS